MATKFLKAQNGGIYRDSTGKPIAVDMSLPALSNPATAEDIANSKEAYGADGAVITGTAAMIENKLPLVVGTQSANNPYDITASDIEGVAEIRGYTFRNCTGLQSIELPPSCTKVGFQSFWACAYMKTANMPNVESINEEAFEQCIRLTTVNMPNVKTIGKDAFMRCESMRWVDMQSVESIGWEAFYNCKKLSTIDIPNATMLDNYAFRNCTAVTSVNMPKVTSIGNSTFEGCNALAHLTIPSTCTSIGSSGLKCGNSTNKCTFTFEGTTPPSIQSNTFDKSYINKIIVPIGCGDTYKTATNWSNFASYIEEATA